MGLAHLVAAVEALDLDQGPEEVADAIWLARFLPPSPVGAERAATAQRGDGTGELTPGPDQLDEPPRPLGKPRQAALPESAAALHLRPPPGQLGTGAMGRPVRVPARSALPDARLLMAALRPFKRSAPDPHHEVLNVEATVEASARCGRLIPVVQPARSRLCNLSLVIDAAPTMAIWDKLAIELRTLCEQLGAFGTVTTWYLQTAGGQVLGVSRAARLRAAGTRLTRPDNDPALVGLARRTALHDITEVIDGAQRQVVLVLTDGADEAWHRGAGGRVLRRWAAAGPVAILQPLPQHLWSRTGLAPLRRGQLASGRSAVPNTSLHFRPHGRGPRWRREADSGQSPVAVPLLELEPEWLRPWSRLVTEPTGATVHCAVTLASDQSRSSPLPLPPPDRDARDRVQRFKASATPQALRLATYLSVGPLSLPVIRHVQQALLPDSRLSHLAEVLLGGLMVAIDSEPHAAEEQRFEFCAGVRDTLLRLLGRTEARRVLGEVSRALAGMIGHSTEQFPALVATASDDEATKIFTASLPFARISAEVLSRIDGDFARVAESRPAPPGRGDDVVQAHRRALATVAPGSPAHQHRRRVLVNALLRRYEQTGGPPYLDEAVGLLREAVTMASAHQVEDLEQLAAVLRQRFSATGDALDLDEAEIALMRAIEAVTSDADRAPALLAALAETRVSVFWHSGDRTYLNRAIQSATEAVRLVDSGPQAAPYRGDLGALLLLRTELDPNDSDLTAAIDHLRAATEDREHPAEQRAKALTNLGTALRLRAERTSGPSAAAQTTPSVDTDLAAAVAALQEAIALTPRDSRNRPARHAALAAVLAWRAGRAGSVRGAAKDQSAADLRRATEAYREAIELAPRIDPARPGYLAGLGSVLRAQANLSGAVVTLGEAIRVLRAARAGTAQGTQAYPHHLAELARALRQRFDQVENLTDLLEASTLLQTAAEAAPAHTAERAQYLSELAELHERKYERTGDPSALAAAARAYQQAALAEPADSVRRPALRVAAGRALIIQRDFLRAVHALEEATAEFTAILTAEHPDTLGAQVELAQALHAAGRTVEARARTEQLVPILTRICGTQHPLTRAARRLMETQDER